MNHHHPQRRQPRLKRRTVRRTYDNRGNLRRRVTTRRYYWRSPFASKQLIILFISRSQFMKITKSRLKQIIKEELQMLGSLEVENNFVKKNNLELEEEAEPNTVEQLTDGSIED